MEDLTLPHLDSALPLATENYPNPVSKYNRITLKIVNSKLSEMHWSEISVWYDGY
jgi:hypothetical protein